MSDYSTLTLDSVKVHPYRFTIYSSCSLQSVVFDLFALANYYCTVFPRYIGGVWTARKLPIYRGCQSKEVEYSTLTFAFE